MFYRTPGFYHIPGTQSSYQVKKPTAKISPIAVGVYHGKTNDCAIRACVNANPEVAYHETERKAQLLGYNPGEGAFLKTWWNLFINSNFELEGVYGTCKKALTISTYSIGMQDKGVISNFVRYPKAMQLKTAIKKFPVGNYIFVITGHVVACVDGELIDTQAIKETERVVAVFKLKD